MKRRKSWAKGLCGVAERVRSPDRNIPSRRAIIPKNAIRLLAQRPSGGWVGVDSDRLKEAQQGRKKKKSTDLGEVRRKLEKSYKRAQRRLPDDRRLAQDRD